MRTSNLDYTSFLVRLWREPAGSVEPPANGHEWLAQVEHIPGGEREYFTSLDDLFAFIREQAAGPPAGKGAGAGEQESRRNVKREP
ncbi:MAG: hypothetical protein ACE5LU_28000 [Anaerolineae bacterium]